MSEKCSGEVKALHSTATTVMKAKASISDPKPFYLHFILKLIEDSSLQISQTNNVLSKSIAVSLLEYVNRVCLVVMETVMRCQLCS